MFCPEWALIIFLTVALGYGFLPRAMIFERQCFESRQAFLYEGVQILEG